MRIATPIIITDAMMAATNIPEVDYVPWSSGTTYALGDRAMYIDANIHHVYESAQTSNTNHTPGVSTNVPTWWLLVGSTNRWRAFDQIVSNQSTMLNQMTMTLVPGEARFDTLALLNVNAAYVTVVQTSAVDGVVYNTGQVSLVSPSGIQDWYAYFFSPVVRLTDYILTDMLPYADCSLSITLDDPGATAMLGEMVLALSTDIGSTQYGASVGIQDYSVKQTDDYGNIEIIERAYAKRGEFTVWVEPEMVSELQQLLAARRATAALYIGSDSYSATYIYGFYKDFNIVIEYVSISVCSIQIEGLT